MSDHDKCALEGCEELHRAGGFCWAHAVPELSKFPTNMLLAMILVGMEADRARSSTDYHTRLLERIAHRLDSR